MTFEPLISVLALAAGAFVGRLIAKLRNRSRANLRAAAQATIQGLEERQTNDRNRG